MSIRFLIYFIVISFFTIQEISSQINWYDTDPESIHNYLNSQFKGEIEKTTLNESNLVYSITRKTNNGHEKVYVVFTSNKPVMKSNEIFQSLKFHKTREVFKYFYKKKFEYDDNEILSYSDDEFITKYLPFSENTLKKYIILIRHNNGRVEIHEQDIFKLK